MPYNPFDYQRRLTQSIGNIGDHHVPVVIQDVSHYDVLKPANLFALGYTYNISDDKWHLRDQAVDYIYTANHIPAFELPGTLGVLVEAEAWAPKNQIYPVFTIEKFKTANTFSDELNFLRVNAKDLKVLPELMEVSNFDKVTLILSSSSTNPVLEMRRFMIEMMQLEITNPVILHRSYNDLDVESFQLYSAVELGALLLDGMGDGIMIGAGNIASPQILTSTSFGILQASRTRISKTEYISCPSCGRTLFDLQETTAKIRAKTNHLKGLKIGIMGCIVNGPGEMADADYGYVGVGKGKINLYKEREVVKKNIPEVDAVDELIELIKEHGDWIPMKL